MRSLRSRALSTLVLVPLLLASAACDSNNDPLPHLELRSESIGAMVAVYGVEEGASGGKRKLVLFDINEPNRFNVIDKAGEHAANPCLSDSKSFVVFEDYEGFGTHSALLRLYDVEQDAMRDLSMLDGQPLSGRLDRCLWKPDNSGFLFTAVVYGGAAASGFYDIETGEIRSIEDQTGYSGLSSPVAWVTDESILVRSINPDLVREWVPESVTGSSRRAVPIYYEASFPDHDILRYIEVEGLKNKPWDTYRDVARTSSLFRYAVSAETYDPVSGTIGFVYISKELNEGGLGLTHIDEAIVRRFPNAGIEKGRLLDGNRLMSQIGLQGPREALRLGIGVFDFATQTRTVLAEPESFDGADWLIEPDF